MVDQALVGLAHLVALAQVNQKVDLVDHLVGLGLVVQMILGDLVVQIVRVNLVALVILVVVIRTIEDLFNLTKYKKKIALPLFLGGLVLVEFASVTFSET